MDGDQLGYFSDLFNATDDPAQRSAAVDQATVAALWGKSGCMLPNPIYGPALKGDLDAVFPVHKRWRDMGIPAC
ncbi:hypothetical protein BH09PSE3_BH09PSE3_16040 [soil metagenome]